MVSRETPCRDHPRIRGEHASSLAVSIISGGSSPHTRGARRRRLDKDEHRRIIPAYAGSTTSPNARACPPRDHPRIRGEHVLQLGADERGHGSSPHTRGARGLGRLGRQLAGIIPAYAGSTS